jgi:hypothetical protein
MVEMGGLEPPAPYMRSNKSSLTNACPIGVFGKLSRFLPIILPSKDRAKNLWNVRRPPCRPVRGSTRRPTWPSQPPSAQKHLHVVTEIWDRATGRPGSYIMGVAE